MCQHYPTAQISVRTICCRKFYDCPKCHESNEGHPLKKTFDLAMICKKCRKAFRKDLRDFDPEADSFCPHCDNEFVLIGESSVAATEAPAAPEDGPRSGLDFAHALQGLDARMIRDGDVRDEDFGIATDYSRRLG